MSKKEVTPAADAIKPLTIDAAGSPANPDAISHIQSGASPITISRRTFNALCVAVAAVIPGISAAQVVGTVIGDPEVAEKVAFMAELREHAAEMQEGAVSKLDIATAAMVSSIFVGVITGSIIKYKKRASGEDTKIVAAQKIFAAIVGGNIEQEGEGDLDAKKEPFVPGLGPSTAKRVMGAEAIRLTTMATLGGHHDQHEATHEFQHVLSDLVPALVLTTLSDLTTSELKVDVCNLVTTVLDELLKIPSYSQIKRPEASADNVSQWEKHLEKVNHDISRSAQAVMAVSYILGPLLTTYAPSAVSDASKPLMVRMLYEKRYSELTYLALSKGEEPNEEEIFNEASEFVEMLMESKTGYSKLLLTLSCNTVGAWLGGDPPEAYYMVSIFANDNSPEKVEETGIAINDPLDHFLTNIKFGSMASALFSTIFTNLWIARAQGKEFSVAHTIQGMLDTLRTVRGLVVTAINKFFGVQGRFREAILEELEASQGDVGGISKQQLQKILTSIPNPGMEFDGSAYIDTKIRSFEAAANLFTKLLNKSDKLKQFFNRIVNRSDTLEHNSDELAGLMKEFQILCDQIDEAVSDEVEQIRKNPPTEAEKPPLSPEDGARQQELKGKIAQTLSGIDVLLRKYKDMDPSVVNDQLRQEFGIPADATPAQVRKHLEKIDKSMMNRVYRKVFGVQTEEDAVPGVDAHHPEEGHVSHFITHAAQEVFFALMTQIPAVNPLKKVLMFALQPTRKSDFTDDELKRIIGLSENAQEQAVSEELSEDEKREKLRQELGVMLKEINGKVAPADLILVDEIIESHDFSNKKATGKKIVELIIETSESLTPEKLFRSLMIIFSGAGTLMSSVADNVAAYLLCERSAISLFQKTFGKDVFLKHQKALKWVKILAKFAAEVAGALTKIANGPNFSQNKYKSVRDSSNPQGIRINKVAYEFNELFYWENAYGLLANSMALSFIFLKLKSLIDEINDDISGEGSPESESAGADQKTDGNEAPTEDTASATGEEVAAGVARKVRRTAMFDGIRSLTKGAKAGIDKMDA